MKTILFIVIVASSGGFSGSSTDAKGQQVVFQDKQSCEAAKNELLAQMATGYDRPNIRAACLQGVAP